MFLCVLNLGVPTTCYAIIFVPGKSRNLFAPPLLFIFTQDFTPETPVFPMHWYGPTCLPTRKILTSRERKIIDLASAVYGRGIQFMKSCPSLETPPERTAVSPRGVPGGSDQQRQVQHYLRTHREGKTRPGPLESLETHPICGFITSVGVFCSPTRVGMESDVTRGRGGGPRVSRTAPL